VKDKDFKDLNVFKVFNEGNARFQLASVIGKADGPEYKQPCLICKYIK